MSERKIKINGIYRHFKGTTHKVIGIAKDSETLAYKVIYTHEEDKSLWVRDKEEFLSLVDTKKYPNIKQKYRFELIEEE